MKQAGSRGVLGLGIMSGTSADGIDVALVRFSGHRAKLENFLKIPFRRSVGKAILRLGEGGSTTTREISQLNFLLGETFADAALAACRKFRVRPKDVGFIGSHGQTIFHQGSPSKFYGDRVASTLQIGDPSVVAVRTGITTVGDFRPADIAAGGQGAPLVPFVDYFLYRHARLGRVALNIGGISNVTVIPKNARIEDVFAFDVGPGNMVIDALVRHFTHGRMAFDRNGEIAQQGKLLPRLLEKRLADSYLKAKPPKSTGRERYGSEYVRDFLGHPEARGGESRDIIRTATILTALSIVDAFHRFIAPITAIDELIVSGGGAHNPVLMAQIAAGLSGIRVLPSGDLGVPEDAKEAYAFAVLANETLHRRASNVPGATGAKRSVILGKVCYAG